MRSVRVKFCVLLNVTDFISAEYPFPPLPSLKMKTVGVAFRDGAYHLQTKLVAFRLNLGKKITFRGISNVKDWNFFTTFISYRNVWYISCYIQSSIYIIYGLDIYKMHIECLYFHGKSLHNKQ